MTAGYFSAIKRVQCTFAEPTDAQNSYVVKAWPEFEIMPKEAIRATFIKDIKAYLFPKTGSTRDLRRCWPTSTSRPTSGP